MAGNHSKFGIYSDEFKTWIGNVDLAAMEAFASLPVAEARIAIAQGEAAVKDALPNIIHEDHPIIAPGVSARVFRQAGTNNRSTPKRPLLMVYHGGGWTVGGHATEPVLVRTLVNKLGFVAVSIDYRMAPEHPYPTPLHDCYEGLLWAQRNADKLGIDPDCVFVGGSSAGGNLSAAVALRARDEGLTCIKGQILIIPALCHYRHFPKNTKDELRSFEDLKNVPVLNAAAMKKFWGEHDYLLECRTFTNVTYRCVLPRSSTKLDRFASTGKVPRRPAAYLCTNCRL